jgi:hypothetical protein
MGKFLVIVAVAGLAAAALDAGAASAGLTVCIDNASGAMRAVASASECTANESSQELATTAEVDALSARVTALESLLAGFSRDGHTLLMSGLNLQLVNGMGQTETLNGLGNLILGYNVDNGDTRTGSHDLVIGDAHTYTSVSGIVSGLNDTLSGRYAFAAGKDNTVSRDGAFVGGGAFNTASADHAFVGGGEFNIARGGDAFVGGGEFNTARGVFGFVGGGAANTARGGGAFVGGGANKTAGPGICAWLANVNLVPC